MRSDLEIKLFERFNVPMVIEYENYQLQLNFRGENYGTFSCKTFWENEYFYVPFDEIGFKRFFNDSEIVKYDQRICVILRDLDIVFDFDKELFFLVIPLDKFEVFSNLWKLASSKKAYLDLHSIVFRRGNKSVEVNVIYGNYKIFENGKFIDFNPEYIVEVFKNVFSDTPEIEIIINDDSSVSVNFSFATLTFYKDLSLGIQTNN